MRKAKWLLLLIVFTLVVAACSSDSDTTTTAADTGGTTDTTAVAGNEYTDVDVTGTEVSVFAAPTGDEGASIQATFDVYNEATGGTVTYEGSDDFEAQLRIRVDGGNPPDIAITPQPGSICVFADAGEIIALEDMGMDIAALEAAHGSYFMNLGVCADGKHYSIPTNANYKSIVWYNKPASSTRPATPFQRTWDDTGGPVGADGRRRLRRHGASASVATPPPGGRARTGSKTSWSVPAALMSTTNG